MPVTVTTELPMLVFLRRQKRQVELDGQVVDAHSPDFPFSRCGR
jgi:hypothetical protein